MTKKVGSNKEGNLLIYWPFATPQRFVSPFQGHPTVIDFLVTQSGSFRVPLQAYITCT